MKKSKTEDLLHQILWILERNNHKKWSKYWCRADTYKQNRNGRHRPNLGIYMGVCHLLEVGLPTITKSIHCLTEDVRRKWLIIEIKFDSSSHHMYAIVCVCVCIPEGYKLFNIIYVLVNIRQEKFSYKKTQNAQNIKLKTGIFDYIKIKDFG